MLTLGQRIASLRTERGLSQSELAAEICFRSTLQQIEADRMIPCESLTELLAERLAIPADELLTARRLQLSAAAKLLLIKAFLEAKEAEQAGLLLANWDESTEGSVVLSRHQLIELRLYRADHLMQTGAAADAIDLYYSILTRIDSLTDANPDEREFVPQIYYRLGKAYLSTQDNSEALTSFTKAYRLSKNFPALLLLTGEIAYHLGWLWRNHGLPSGATAYLKEADEIFSKMIGIESPVAPVAAAEDTDWPAMEDIEYH